ncbi:MAG: hypothetical protein KC478_10835 [Bacteriovoracaceae bacterium]|nr:hypothetical protein [Bacteriovoracaceae bacterium]
MTTQGLKVTSNVAYAQTDGTNGTNGTNATNGTNGSNGTNGTTGTNSQNFQTTQSYIQEGQDQESGGGWLDQLLMLAIGYIVAGWFIKCGQPLPADMIVAAVGAGILIIGEIAAIASYQGTAAEMEMAYQADHEGKMLNNDDQVAAFRKELENNESIEEALELKLGLQIAAEVAFAAALGVAIAFIIAFYAMGAICVAGAALATCPGTCQLQCTATSGIAISLMGLEAVPQNSLSEYAQKKAQAASTNPCPACIAFANFAMNQYFGGCASFAYDNTNPGFVEGMYAKLMNSRPELNRVAQVFAKDYNDKHFNDDPTVDRENKLAAEKEMIYEELTERGFKSLNSEHPILAGIPFSPLINPESDNEFNYYLKTYENNKFKKGEVRSLSLDEYQNFSELYGYNELDDDSQKGMKNLLAVAAEKGIDLMFPKAEANFGNLLILVGGALLALILINNTIFDLMLGSGTKRAITYTAFIVAVGFGIKATNDDLTAIRSNIDKLNEIINNLSDLSSGPMAQHVENQGGGGGGGKIDRPQIDPNGDQIELALEDDKPTPCLGGSNPNGCNNIQDKYKTASALEGLNLGADLSSAASTTAGIGDDLSNTKTLNSGTIGKLNGLIDKKGSLFKNNRRLADMLNKSRKGAKQGPLDLTASGNKMFGDMQKAMLQKIKDDKLNPGQLLSSAGIPTASKKSKDASKTTAKGPQAPVQKGGKAAAKPKKPKLDFGFGDDEASVANADSAAEMDDPNAIGEDEEYVLDDIVKDEGASLWQIISVRYLKSGYNRLRGKDKKPVPAKISE